MNREIEFRAWYKGICLTDIGVFSNHIWISERCVPDNIPEDFFDSMEDAETGYFLLSGYILEQYTGLKDKNGVKIFEGHIVESYAYSKAIVIWDEYHAAFDVYCESNAEDDQHFYVNKDIGTDYDIEVIGNIHE